MSTDRVAVIGDPIEHSLSPAMHTAALAAAGIDGNYEAVQVSPAQLHAAVGQLRREYRGFNVTLPHKEAILPFLDFLDPSARDVRAANTVVNGHEWLIFKHATCASRITILDHWMGREVPRRAIIAGGAENIDCT